MNICPFLLIVIAVVLFRIRFEAFVADVLILLYSTAFSSTDAAGEGGGGGGGMLPYKKGRGCTSYLLGVKKAFLVPLRVFSLKK